MERVRINPKSKKFVSQQERPMKGYISPYRMADAQILGNMSKFRIYARLGGFISEGIFNKGQSALDATFALMASLSPPHIDYILDMRFSDPWPDDILKLWKKKALEIFSKYSQVYAVVLPEKPLPFGRRFTIFKRFSWTTQIASWAPLKLLKRRKPFSTS
jgi:hypothetical protein